MNEPVFIPLSVPRELYGRLQSISGKDERLVMSYVGAAVRVAVEQDEAALNATSKLRRDRDKLLEACKSALNEFRSIRPHIRISNENGMISGQVLSELEIAILEAEDR